MKMFSYHFIYLHIFVYIRPRARAPAAARAHAPRPPRTASAALPARDGVPMRARSRACGHGAGGGMTRKDKMEDLIRSRLQAENDRKQRIEQNLRRVRASILAAATKAGVSGIEQLAAAAADAPGAQGAAAPAFPEIPKRQRRTNIFKKAVTDLSM